MNHDESTRPSAASPPLPTMKIGSRGGSYTPYGRHNTDVWNLPVLVDLSLTALHYAVENVREAGLIARFLVVHPCERELAQELLAQFALHEPQHIPLELCEDAGLHVPSDWFDRGFAPGWYVSDGVDPGGMRVEIGSKEGEYLPFSTEEEGGSRAVE